MREATQRGLGLIVLLLCLGPEPAWGTDNGRNTRQSEPSANSSSTSGSVSGSLSASGGMAAAEGGQATGGSAEAAGGNVGDVTSGSHSEGSTANSTSGGGEGGNASVGGIVVDASTSSPGSVKIRNTPTVVAPDVFPTVPCFRTGSISGAGPGLGFSWGGGKIDPGCEAREEIRLAAAVGLINRALYRWCQLPNNVESFGSLKECLEFDPVPEDEPEEPETSYNTVSGGNEIILAEVKQEDFDNAVERARIREEKQAELMAEIVRRVEAAEKKQAEIDAIEERREQGIQEYNAKWGEPGSKSGG